MEFVEGETVENLIKRSGRLEPRLAVEIATQAAAGLVAVHKQKLVHRDIKPSNIMVSAQEGNAVPASAHAVKAVICGCNAGLFSEALHEVYIQRIQQGDSSFAANVLGVRGLLLSVLASSFLRTRTLGITR
jgi:serine/threonine protein kinase